MALLLFVTLRYKKTIPINALVSFYNTAALLAIAHWLHRLSENPFLGSVIEQLLI